MPAYVPILKNKLAEFWAWTHASPAVVNSSRVLFELVPGTDANSFAVRLARDWPPGAVVTVDSTAINHPASAVLQVAQALNQRHVPERPVMRLSDSRHLLAEVAAACALHGQGACLRLGSEAEDPDPNVPTPQVASVLSAANLRSQDVDLLIDFWEVNSPRDVTRCVPLALNMLVWAAANGPWRSVTLASGAFPQSITNLPVGAATPLTRHDADLFAQVVAGGPAIQPDYGDYGINHPFIQPPIPRAPKPNLRYTDDNVWQVYREDRLLPGNESFFTVCARLVASGHWAGAAYSAGDAEIERCSRSVGGPGAATQWLAYGRSHHMAHVVDRLANHGVP